MMTLRRGSMSEKPIKEGFTKESLYEQLFRENSADLSMTYFDEKDEDKKEKEKASDIATTWATTTNCHGIPRIQTAKTWGKRIFWILLFLGAMCGFIAQTVTICEVFFSYQVSTTVKYEFRTRIQFPAVTICNVNAVRRSKLALGGSTISGLFDEEEVSGREKRNTPGSSANNRLIQTSDGDRLDQFNDFLVEWSDLDEDTAVRMGHQLEDMLLGCTYNGHSCNSSDFELLRNNLYGNCYIFNSGWRDRNILYSYRAGPQYGLSLELFIEQEEYIAGLTEDAGVKVLPHHQNDMPFPDDQGVLASPGHLTSISVTKTNVFRQAWPYVTLCNSHQSEEHEYNAYAEMYPVKYTQKACYRTCTQFYIISDCGCVSSDYPKTGVAYSAVFTGSEETCSYNDTCVDGVKHRFSNGLLNCNCSWGCSDTYFAPTVSSSQWPNDQYQSIYDDAISTSRKDLKNFIIGANASPRKNLLKVKVFFEELNYQEIKESPAYTIGNMAADFGGIVGLYLGMSVLAVFELIELIFDLLHYSCKKRSVCKSKNAVKEVTASKTSLSDKKVSPVGTITTSLGELPRNYDLPPLTNTGYWYMGRGASKQPPPTTYTA
ncbi:degenerin unc-8-like [Lineus longissimus]|uniref:degenerin unc-8-like n=1 Tax=Lineus longissimus TaxID=88925 RepID=UPI00315DFD98